MTARARARAVRADQLEVVAERRQLDDPHAVGEARRSWFATACASRVLPMPPAPASVTSRCSPSSRHTAAMSATRPCSVGSCGRQVGQRRRRARAHGRRSGASPSAGAAAAGAAVTAPRRAGHREAIAAARDRRDRLRPEHLAQREHLHLQVVVLDDAAGPDEIEQLGARHRALAPLDQREQQIERASAELGRLAVDEQLPLGRQQREPVEAQRRGVVGGHGGRSEALAQAAMLTMCAWIFPSTGPLPKRSAIAAAQAAVASRQARTGTRLDLVAQRRALAIRDRRHARRRRAAARRRPFRCAALPSKPACGEVGARSRRGRSSRAACAP